MKKTKIDWDKTGYFGMVVFSFLISCAVFGCWMANKINTWHEEKERAESIAFENRRKAEEFDSLVYALRPSRHPKLVDYADHNYTARRCGHVYENIAIEYDCPQPMVIKSAQLYWNSK